MRHRLFPLFFCFAFLLAVGCRKAGAIHLDCTNFRQGIVNNEVERVRHSLADLLGPYSQENINQLAQAISGQCAVSSTMDCFECIKTLPPQTEIIVSFTENGTTYRKRLDISFTPDNRMKMVAMHD